MPLYFVTHSLAKRPFGPLNKAHEYAKGRLIIESLAATRIRSQSRFVWLLWLALLLPLAQTAANWHVLAHVAQDASQQTDGNPGLPHWDCPDCLAATGLGGAAPFDEPFAPRVPSLLHEAPKPAQGGIWTAPSTRAYQSRAPPIALH